MGKVPGEGERGPPQLPSSERKKREREGPYHYAKQHGPADDPPDFLIPVDPPAPTAEWGEDVRQRQG